jgi:hypothetical protein
MSNLFIHDIVGSNDFAVPASDSALGTATTELDALLSGVALLDYERIVAWVETADGVGPSRTLNCLLEKLEYNSEECPDATETQTMTASIEATLEADADITSIGTQDVHIFQAGTFFHWLRDSSSGFLYPATAADDVAVGGHLAPQGMWFNDGDLVLGAAAMSGTEVLRVVGHERLEGGLLMTERASTSAPAAGEGIFWVENTAPNLPKFTDDGPNISTLLYGGAQLSLLGIDQVLIVDKTSESYTPDGSQQEPYNSIGAAITAATALTPTTSNRILILIYPGIYSEALTTADSFVYFAGFDRDSTIIRQSSGTSAPLTVTDDETSFTNLTFEVDTTHTGRIFYCGTNLGGGPVRFYNCGFLGNGATSTNNYVEFASVALFDVEFHDSVFANADDTEWIYYNVSGNTVEQRFYNCTFAGQVYDRNVNNSSTLEAYNCEFEASGTAATDGALRLGSSRNQGFKFFGCKFTNTGTTGPAVYGDSGLSVASFSNCGFNGGSSGYDVAASANGNPSFNACNFMRGLSRVVPDGNVLHVGTGPQNVPFYQDMPDAILAINANAIGDYRVVLLEDQTLAAQLASVGGSRDVVFDGQGLYTIDRAGARIIQVNTSVTNRFRRIQLKGEVYIIGNGSLLYLDRSRVEGRIHCGTTNVASFIRVHDSALVGDATYTSPLFINYFNGDLGGVYFSGCYLKGNTGSPAVLYGILFGTTLDFDDLYMERTVCMHGSLGTNNPFGGQGQGGSPPVNDYYAHTCTFNQEPDVADPTYLDNRIDTGQRKNTIDPDGDYHFMMAAW